MILVDLGIALVALAVGYYIGMNGNVARPKNPNLGYVVTRLDGIEEISHSLARKLDYVMSQDDDLLAAIQAVSADQTQIGADVQTVIGLLKQVPGNDPKVAQAIAALGTIKSNADAIDASLKTAIGAPGGGASITTDPTSLSLSLSTTPTGTFIATGTGNIAATAGTTGCTVTPASAPSPATFTVLAVAQGPDTISLTDDSGATGSIVATVTA